MSEAEFWVRLEFRVCSELSASTKKLLRFLWCDGLSPAKYEVKASGLHISGDAWVYGNDRYEGLWSFAMQLEGYMGSREEIEWENVLPEEDVHGWLQVHPAQRRLHIRLSNGSRPSGAHDCSHG